MDAGAEARRILARRELERRQARADLSLLLDQMSMVDEKTGEVFRFYLNEPASPWYWQRTLVWDAMLENRVRMFYKARQLGITWLCAGRQLARALTVPGTRYLVFRQREEDAIKIVDRQWDLLLSLPEHLRYGVKVLKPHRGLERDDVRPEGEIELLHPNGRRSTIQALPPTGDPGHGETVAGVLLDEAARIKKLRDVLKAVMATVGTLGEVDLVSTANGVANEEGEGNYFAHLWNTAEERRITAVFLSTDLHPDRDDAWYETAEEYLVLDSVGRAEQYPRTPEEGFQGTAGECFFDRDALAWYASNAIRRPLYRLAFERKTATTAVRKRSDGGLIRVYEEPQYACEECGSRAPAAEQCHGAPRAPVKYGLSVDVATGRGRDYSAVYVIDLATRALAAEIKAKIDPDLLAFQLHYLGRWYHTALIAVETASGFGEAVIIPLRDGREGRPAYPRLYRRVRGSRPDHQTAKAYGFPITKQSREEILPLLARAIRERQLPWLTSDLLHECRTFVRAETGTSPRAADGCNDDCVLSAAIALELYRLRGHHPDRPARRTTGKHKHWLPLGNPT